MAHPIISVILPAYNCERYIRSAVQSVLDQTFRDFELIILDDGSTDQTAAVIATLADDRIRFVANEYNLGLVQTLNKGVALAHGRYIARMDGDDISVPERFARQLELLDTNPGIGLVTTTADLIDEEDQSMGTWKDDVRNVSETSIRSFLPKDNCIVHPAVMARTEILRSMPFSQTQAQAEDYDLWLRMSARGVRIAKIATPLLRHRILKRSFTRTRQQNVFWKNARTKLRFVKEQGLKGMINGFVIKTFFYGLKDLAAGLGKNIKQRISH